MDAKQLKERIKETKELIKYSQKNMDSEAVKELKEDLVYYKQELQKLS